MNINFLGMKISKVLICIICVALSMLSCSQGQSHYYYECETPSSINDFLCCHEGVLISGHRGGNLVGYPENCIETFDKILDRTTTGTGLVKDYTYDELQSFNLVDRWGNITSFKIPSVEDVVIWSKDKVILNFDIKDVTRDVLVPLVWSLGAVNCMYTVRNTVEALEVYRLDQDARMLAWIRNLDEFNAYANSGIPWETIPMAYVVSDVMTADNHQLYLVLRANGVRCMFSTALRQDKLPTSTDRLVAFEEVLKTGLDVVGSDFPTEFVRL